MRSLLSSPSGGEFEVLRALYLARGHNGNLVADNHLLRHLPPHTLLTDVQTVLTGESGTYVTTDGQGNWTLTAAGVTRSRANKPRRDRITVS